MVMASTSILSQVTSGNSAATSAAISSHITMPWRWALDLVTTVSSLRGRERASSKAKRMMRVTPAAGENGHLGGDLLGKASMGAPALPGILALGILAHDHPVQVLGPDPSQRALDAGEDAGGADIGVLVERLADVEAQAPQRDVVGHVGRAHRAEVDGVEFLQRRAAILRHHDAVLLVIVRSPVEGLDVQAEAAVALRQGLENFEAGSAQLPCRCRHPGWRRS